nr:hypothetical protein BaRGS_030357 [Batillaria attramentaria]
MANPRFGGDDLPPLSRSDGEEVSPLPDDTRDGLLPLPRPPNLATRNKVCKNSDLDLEELVDVLHGLGIPTNIERHLVRSEREEDDTRELRHRPDGVYCKNLLLRDKKGLTYLIICHEDDLADLKVVKYHLHAQGNVYFASRDSVSNLLRVLPGAVTPLALIHPSASGVRVHIDASLMDRVDRDVTKLYFHPLRAELQVSLTLAELERFLNHCGVTLNRLPSLTSYTAGRRFHRYEGGGGRGRGSHGYWQRKMLKMMQDENQDEEEDPGTCDKDKANPAIRPLAWREKKDGAAESDGEIRNDDNDDDLVTDADTAGGTAVYSECGGSITMGENGDTSESCGEWQSMESELGALGIQVETVPAVGLELTTNTCIACKSVFMKDKRDNHFLLVCHELQKTDFSNLKTQLKPRKKITPLEPEELWSLSRIHQQLQTPFHLTRFKQPRVLVAMADNLQTDKKHNVMLTFPHPAVDKLKVKISLHDLVSLVGRTDHDVVTIPVKGISYYYYYYYYYYYFYYYYYYYFYYYYFYYYYFYY